MCVAKSDFAAKTHSLPFGDSLNLEGEFIVVAHCKAVIKR